MPRTRIDLHLPEGKSLYFASDLHLGFPDARSSREREKKFVCWLEEIAPDAGAVFLVGDIFDFWFDYRKAVPRGFTRVLGQLARMTDSGIPVYYFYGNHDMWHRDYLQTETGLQIIPDEAVVTVNESWRLYVAHGDGLGPGDRSYKWLKKIFRHPFSQWLYRLLHPDLGIPLAAFFSRWSRKSADPEITRFLGPEREHLIRHSLKVLETEKFDFFIYGHRHHIAEYQLNEKARYYNLGDWLTHSSFLEWRLNGPMPSAVIKEWDKIC